MAQTSAAPALVNSYAPDGFFPLALAVYFGNLDTAMALLDAGADINIESREAMKISALHSAISKRRIDLVTMLLDRGANPNARAQGGLTPMHAAALGGLRDIARALIARGADVTARDVNGRTTPLDLAAVNNHESLVDLLQAGTGA